MTALSGRPDYSRYRWLRVEAAGRVLTITIDRPERLNAVHDELHEELRDVWVDVGNDYETDVVLLTGAGRAFCSGGDIKEMMNRAEPYGGGRSIEPLAVMSSEARRLCRNMLDVEQPIVAAVNGDAFGLGANIALCCDIVVIAEDAQLADTHVKVGLVAGDGGPVLWPMLVGPLRAKEYLLRGSRITGREAVQLGLANHAVPRGEVLDTAAAIAAELADGSPLAIRWTKYAVNKLIKEVYERAFDVAIAYELTTMRSVDHQEGLAALMEKRPPKFRGR